MKQQDNKKVLIIFPSYRKEEATHYPYWYEIFEEVAKKLDVVLLFESGEHRSTITNAKFVKTQKITLKPFNLIERLYFIFYFINLGYRKVYIHYSYWSVFLCKFISLFYPIKIFYWNCEKYHKKPKGLLLPITLRFCDVLVTGTKSIGESYRKVFNLKNKSIEIIPNWVEKSKIKPLVFSSNKIHILFVHHIAPRKGSRDLPALIQKALRKKSNIHFNIIGSGPDEKWLKQEIKNHLSSITFFGNIPQKEIAAFFKSADYFIMPSRSEGFPRVILEAMLYKIPFVSTDVGCVKEIASKEQKQFIVKPGNSKEFTQALIKLIDFTEKEKLVSANYKKVLYFNKRNTVKAMIKLLNR